MSSESGRGREMQFVTLGIDREVFGVPVSTVNREEGPAYGAALLAAVGVGAFPDLSTAAKATLTRQPSEVPSPEAHAAYDAPYRRFRDAVHAARA